MAGDVYKRQEHPGEVFSPNQIYEQVWQDNPYGTENTVAVHIRPVSYTHLDVYKRQV